MNTKSTSSTADSKKGIIAFVISSTGWGGLEMNVLKLAFELQQLGWYIVLYCQPGTKIFDEGIVKGLSVVALERRPKYLAFRKAYLFSQMLKEAKVEMAVAFDNRDLDFIFLIKTFFYPRLKTVYQQHMRIDGFRKDVVHTLRYSALDAWVAPLQSIKEEVIKYVHYPPAKIKVVPIGVDVARLQPARYTRETARQALGIIDANMVIGVLGRIDAKKGQMMMVLALQQLRTKGMQVSLLIMGNTTINDAKATAYYNELETTIEKHLLKPYVYIKQHTTDVQLFYQAIDIFVLPSEAETYGMVTIEAMLSGKPILATAGGGTSEILKGGELGTLFEYNDLEGACSKLEAMVTNLAPYLAIANAANKNALITYTLDLEVQGWHLLLMQLKAK